QHNFSSNYIQDASGTDIFDASQSSENVHIDLNQGGWSYIGEKQASILAEKQTVIGFGSEIENAKGGSGDDTLTGNQLDNQLVGGQGADTLIGGKGNDQLQGNEGEDTLKGGEGVDTYAFNSQELDATDHIIDSDGKGRVMLDNQVWSDKDWTETAQGSQIWKDSEGNTLALANNQLTLTTADGKTVAVIEDFANGDLGFDFTSINHAPEAGNSLAEQNTTTGQAWSYALPANSFTDADGDTLTYSATLADGSALPDWLTIDSATGALSGTPDTAGDFSVIITAADPAGETATQTLSLSIVTPEIIQVNGVYEGDNSNNIAQGNDQADTLYGLGGNDQLSGGANNDWLSGGSGDDILNGESGDDTLDGNDGDDVLTGGTGNDTLSGGQGSDTYIFGKNFGQD
ncbi:MAG: hypothetical protein CR977_03835, partial [Gammaproteobacteria bacterium]